MRLEKHIYIYMNARCYRFPADVDCNVTFIMVFVKNFEGYIISLLWILNKPIFNYRIFKKSTRFIFKESK